MVRIARHVRRNAVAWLALFFALAGTGVAASRYIITSRSQIKPSVRLALREEVARALRGEAVASKLAAKGVHSVVARVRSTSFTTSETPTNVPLSGGTWTQHTEEDDQLMGQVLLTRVGGCEAELPEVEIFMDGKRAGDIPVHDPGIEGQTAIFPIYWDLWQRQNEPELTGTMFEPESNVTHTLTAKAFAPCITGHFIISAISIDVLGSH